LKALRAALPASFFALVLGAACGGGQTQGGAFDSAQRDDGTAMAALQKQLASVTIPLGADVAVGVFGERSLVGVPLAGGEPWTFEHAIACRPVLAGRLVVGLGANEMFGLDALTGKQLWTRKAAGCPRGIADDGKITVVSVRPVTGVGGIVLAIDHEGQIIRQIEDTANIGIPGIVGGVLFLPWNSRYVSAYDVAVGEEVARVRFPELVTRAFVVGGALFFGERTATRFDDRIGLVPADKASTLALPERALPDHPTWMESGNDSLPPGSLPADRVRLYARPASSGSPALAGGRYAATHGHVALGLDAKDGATVWVHTSTADFLGGAAYQGGFALCDAEGNVAFLDAQTGALAGLVSLGVPVDACVVQADGFSKTKAAPRPLRDQMAEAIRLRAPGAEPVQRFLLSELARSSDERATETLIQLATSDAASRELVEDIRAALAERRSGASFMLAALAVRYDYLDDVLRPAPVGPLADALAAMNEKRAAPLLAEHLTNPATPPAGVERAAAALAVLAGPEQVAALRWFFAAYRSEAAEAAIVLAVAHVARALERLGSGDVVAAALRDPYTSDAVKSKIASSGGAGNENGAR
jgi:outer membrane protein assembly factor BamB